MDFGLWTWGFGLWILDFGLGFGLDLGLLGHSKQVSSDITNVIVLKHK